MPADAPETRLEITAPPTDDPLSLAVAPDGRQVVFAGRFESGSRLWVRRFDSVARPLSGTDGGSFPFWSPDSRSIGFFADSKLKRIDVESGAIQVLADAVGVEVGRGPRTAPSCSSRWRASDRSSVLRPQEEMRSR